ncbi:glycoside hydrolase family 25 [Catenulispora acidiphila DSM 44928]|uniref:Glycoside hydrolase family 25 n=1 Tax=Catenulispora acidiphila (strain DSM 44928 / JCM 14897 / NBRC 102108 / NRRL B-24433 / ID139908) TaxID=479433 RepID=C7Q163_CATAD|nr:GH25 family lysozyme [Catenulispora acidiphila]ACU71738.1 glycoside hydrolase family 25 [Catenulispora acidiphila DSM 44928]
MTIFGPDISSFQSGLVLSRLADAAFVLAKTTEGTYYTDADYQAWRAQAAALRRPFAWYHFLSGEDAHAQAAHTLANVGDVLLPGMLDAEPAGKFSPTLKQILAYIDAAHDAGLNLRLLYLPRWFWQQLGSPSLSGVADRGVSLVSSAYPGGSGGPAAIYPGDGAAGWKPYGEMTPLIYQFTNKASDGGQQLDYNAYKGTAAQLVADLKPPAPATVTPPPSTPTPASTDPRDDTMPAFATGEITPGTNAVTMVLPPPANYGAAGWGNVWFSLGADMGTATVRVAIFTHGQGWSHIYEDVVVDAAADRVNPFGGPLPTAVQKISVTRRGNPNVPLAYLVEAVHR